MKNCIIKEQNAMFFLFMYKRKFFFGTYTYVLKIKKKVCRMEIFEVLNVILDAIDQFLYHRAFHKEKPLKKRIPYLILYFTILFFILFGLFFLTFLLVREKQIFLCILCVIFFLIIFMLFLSPFFDRKK